MMSQTIQWRKLPQEPESTKMWSFPPFLFSCFIAFFCIIFGSLGHSKQFRNAYVSFEIPEKWNCVLEQTEWVCRSESQEQSKQAIIILTAKEVGPSDSFEAYTSHLNTPQAPPVKRGGEGKSKVVYSAKNTSINNHTWLDGLHLGSEIPNYYTRYVATIKGKIAVLVTFSAHQKFYTQFTPDFIRAVNSLRVIAAPNLLGENSGGQVGPSGASGILGGPLTAMPNDMMTSDMESAPGSKIKPASKKKNLFLWGGIILLSIVGYILLKKK